MDPKHLNEIKQGLGAGDISLFPGATYGRRGCILELASSLGKHKIKSKNGGGLWQIDAFCVMSRKNP